MRLEITNDERDDVIRGLNALKCFMETGTATMTRNDAIARGKSNIIRPLSSDQQRTIDRMEGLVARLYKGQ